MSHPRVCLTHLTQGASMLAVESSLSANRTIPRPSTKTNRCRLRRGRGDQRAERDNDEMPDRGPPDLVTYAPVMESRSESTSRRSGEIPASSPPDTRRSASVSCEEQSPVVYFNGLPSAFNEDRLFSIVSPFGAVICVRVHPAAPGPTPNGYGFVMFASPADAQKCVASLSGTDPWQTQSSDTSNEPSDECSSVDSSSPPSSPSSPTPHPFGASDTDSLSSPSTSPPSSPSSCVSDTSISDFLARVPPIADLARPSPKSEIAPEEALQSPALSPKPPRRLRVHTNSVEGSTISVRGLPIGVDKLNLAQLAHPHPILNSRFFEINSRIPGNSMSVMAFIRLPSRQVAESIIAEHDGRKVRGLNRTKSKLSVRIVEGAQALDVFRVETPSTSLTSSWYHPQTEFRPLPPRRQPPLTTTPVDGLQPPPRYPTTFVPVPLAATLDHHRHYHAAPVSGTPVLPAQHLFAQFAAIAMPTELLYYPLYDGMGSSGWLTVPSAVPLIPGMTMEAAAPTTVAQLVARLLCQG
uniref:RRM domain-containing protein n=1 Tax=Mycena chlorophos TaxID=658473 RepID=A0ABQ0L087_MYCCL|nr:predicted protein [Mycena chlorophos]